MIEGAVIALVSVLVGRFLPGRKKNVSKPVPPRCGCGHTIGFHENKTGKCSASSYNHYTEVTTTCTCRHYDGPIPVESFFTTPLITE